MMPMIKKPLSKIAMAPLPGTPNATVGINSPPSFELFARRDPHAANIALAETRSLF